MADPSTRLNNNVQYVINLLKTYGYPQQVLDSFKQDIDKILVNTKDNNRIDAANKYIDQFLGDKSDLRRLDPVPGKPVAGGGQPATQNDKTDKPVVVTGGQPSNDNSSKKTIGWSSGKGYMYEDDHPNNWRTSYGNSGKIKDRDTYTRGSVPGSMGLRYTEPSQVQMTRNDAVPETFSDSGWNAAHGISYVTGKDGLIYRIDPQHPNGYVDPFKNDLSKTGSTGYATGKGMLTSSSNDSYATGEGIKDANGNVLTNPGGDWEYQYALKDPQYGLGMMGKMSDAQKKYLQAVSDDMGYKYNFTGAPRFV